MLRMEPSHPRLVGLASLYLLLSLSVFAALYCIVSEKSDVNEPKSGFSMNLCAMAINTEDTSFSEKISNTAPSVKAKLQNTVENIKDSVEGTKEEIVKSAEDLKEKSKRTADEVGDKAKQAVEQIGEKAEECCEGCSELVEKICDFRLAVWDGFIGILLRLRDVRGFIDWIRQLICDALEILLDLVNQVIGKIKCDLSYDPDYYCKTTALKDLLGWIEQQDRRVLAGSTTLSLPILHINYSAKSLLLAVLTVIVQLILIVLCIIVSEDREEEETESESETETETDEPKKKKTQKRVKKTKKTKKPNHTLLVKNPKTGPHVGQTTSKRKSVSKKSTSKSEKPAKKVDKEKDIIKIDVDINKEG